ncbi:MAG: hypothetical protein HYY13_03400 [Nitrospirae bacterium]|nr:hypothetical protein [Nitrospirota bacterium]
MTEVQFILPVDRIAGDIPPDKLEEVKATWRGRILSCKPEKGAIFKVYVCDSGAEVRAAPPEKLAACRINASPFFDTLVRVAWPSYRFTLEHAGGTTALRWGTVTDCSLLDLEGRIVPLDSAR